MDERLCCRSTGLHPAGGVIVLPAVCTTTKATMTSPLVVPAGTLMGSVEPPAPLLPVAAARSEIPDGGGGGVGGGEGGGGVGGGGGRGVGGGVGVGAGWWA